MCRIFGGIINEGNIAPILRIGLKRLEYGGYDSAGIATVYQKRLFLKKDVGKIDEIHKKHNFDDLPGKIGIAHTRWATHGAPSKENAHPLTDCKNNIAVVHNGIIDNYLEIKKELEQKGHVFISKTDTEVISHLIEENYKRSNDIYLAFLYSIKRLTGSFALAVISSHDENKIFVAKRNSPLLLGIGKNENFVSSDAVAFIDRTKEILALNDDEVAILTIKGFEIYDIKSGVRIKRKTKIYDWNFEIASKGGYEHFMLKEIMEQPVSISWTMSLQKPYLNLMCEYMDKANKIFLVASGTSYNSCIAGSYYYSNLANLASYPSIASEFIDQFGSSIDINSLILFVSQSGETMDVLQAVDFARIKGATILAITNVAYSTLTRVSRAYILQQSGPEIGVAATKTYTSQLLVHLLLAFNLGIKRGKLSQNEIDKLKLEMNDIPNLINQVLLKKNEEIRNLAKIVSTKKNVIFLGKGLNFATALEGRLKLLEISYIPSIAINGSYKDLELLNKKDQTEVAVIAIVPPDSNRKDIINILDKFANEVDLILLADETDSELTDFTNYIIKMPSINTLFSPIIYIIPLQLLAYYAAIHRKLDPDKPRNLAKSVTVI